ncbi:glycosyltransferase family 31 [Drechmeria coniospora]|uniref:N-acetylgalactosaminide beta-1,3-galactosyltransferase n=1 Tax=Drechmeria coniospora TaxID=98403 RepID=A0A151GIG1_DRECN|nr:glycosyltransferase family 31 [Drechmeria coniospora]KYK56876.1 glycosyltransferase family 31 [Drechmeria coniospora]ODA78301.1 hypothetical protein RJ55_05682 [Drechmeria coniospora]
MRAADTNLLNMPRRLRRRLVVVGTLFLLTLAVLYLRLPPDSTFRLALGFNAARVANFLQGKTSDRDGWLRQPARYRVDLRTDVGYLIKTGYGTRHRVPEQLRALGGNGGLLGEEGRSFLVVGDWTTVNKTEAKMLGAQVHDAIRMVMETKIDSEHSEHQRFTKYKTLQGAVAAGDEEKALHLGQTYGWELDALKFIMGMEFAYKRLPQKKWYIMLDDDTYLVKPSLELLLGHLNPAKAQYLGNAVGDYKGRFAHGGSAVLLSGEAMKRLFSQRHVLSGAYVASLDETWGDRLVATTLQKVGVYLDERYCHYFNGEAPSTTRIREDRICSPVVSFHGLRTPGAMAATERALTGIKDPVLWGQLWALFAREPIEAYGKEAPPYLAGDHVGARGEQTKTWKEIHDDEECRAKCQGASRGWCLAWTYEPETSECHGSPWMVVGEERGVKRDVVSGVNWRRVEPLMRQCSLLS